MANTTTKTHRKWSNKYKRSINCRRPRGFSQRQYCKYGRDRRQYCKYSRDRRQYCKYGRDNRKTHKTPTKGA